MRAAAATDMSPPPHTHDANHRRRRILPIPHHNAVDDFAHATARFSTSEAYPRAERLVARLSPVTSLGTNDGTPAIARSLALVRSGGTGGTHF